MQRNISRDFSTEEKARHSTLKDMHDDLQRHFDRRLDQIEARFKARDDETKRIKILDWLSPLPYTQHHIYSRRNKLKGTGQWFLDDNCVRQWRESSVSSILWLHGIPGSGKSKLV